MLLTFIDIRKSHKTILKKKKLGYPSFSIIKKGKDKWLFFKLNTHQLFYDNTVK